MVSLGDTVALGDGPGELGCISKRVSSTRYTSHLYFSLKTLAISVLVWV